MTRSNNKLNYVKIELFKIIKNIKEVSFKLKLSKSMQWKYSVFHISLLKPASDIISILEQVSDNYLIKQEDWYEVKRILQHKNINKQRHYLVKWKSYSDFKNIWKSEENLNRYLKIIEKYFLKEVFSD